VHIRFRQYLRRRRKADSITIFEALESWKDLLVATAGASAALAGLVTVAIATNIGEIVKFRGYRRARRRPWTTPMGCTGSPRE
jgi:hypothetical protein